MALGEDPVGAVAQAQRIRWFRLRLEPGVMEDAAQVGPGVPAAGTGSGGRCHGHPMASRDLSQRDVALASVEAFHRLEQHQRGRLVVTFRHRHGEFLGGAPIELGRAARTGSRAATPPSVLDIQEARGGQPVEMEGGKLPCDAHAIRRLVARDGVGLAAT